MAKASNRTKVCRRNKIVFEILHFLALFGPFLYFIPYSFATGEMTDKLVLGFDVVVSAILVLIAVFIDTTHKAGLFKSVFWLLIAGILFVLESLQSISIFIYIMVAVSLLDELVFTRIIEHYKIALISNKEQDKRG